MKKENRTKLLRCRISEEGYNAFISICKKKDIDTSKAIREAIREWYIKNKEG